MLKFGSALINYSLFRIAMVMKKTDNLTPEASSGAPDNPGRRRLLQASAAVGMLGTAAVSTNACGGAKPVAQASSLDAKIKANIKQVVVIYLA